MKMTMSSSDHEEATFGWINWFLTLKGNEYFCQIEEDYIQDNFNLTGLISQIPYYDFALDLVTDIENEEELTDQQLQMIEHDAEVLYGLVHARYILTTRGLYAMLEKYRHHDFGSCPRHLCNHQALLPVGITDQKAKESVKLYCADCKEIYKCRSSRHENVDGAYFGTTFPHLFFLVFPELQPTRRKVIYTPRIFGFRIHATAHERSLEAVKKHNQRRKRERSQANIKSSTVVAT